MKRLQKHPAPAYNYIILTSIPQMRLAWSIGNVTIQDLGYGYNEDGGMRWRQDVDSLVAGHGYTGHEHLPGWGLINMNARLYDPALCRFLSPDPVLQDPLSTQNFNRYSYCLNNPLKYTDESGEFCSTLIIGAVLGGVINWAANGCEFTINGFYYFIAGAAIGALFSGTSFLTTPAIATCGLLEGALAGASIGAATGTASGLLTNGFNNLISGREFLRGAEDASLSGMISGSLSGSLSGSYIGGKHALQSGRNVWWGNDIKNGRGQWSLFNVEKPQVFTSPVTANYGLQKGECVLRCLEEFSYSYNDDAHDFNYWLQKNENKLGVAPSKVADLINASDVYGSESLMLNSKSIINAFSNNQRILFGFSSKTGSHAVMISKIKLWSNGIAKIFFQETSPIRIVDYSTTLNPDGFIVNYPSAKIWSFYKK